MIKILLVNNPSKFNDMIMSNDASVGNVLNNPAFPYGSDNYFSNDNFNLLFHIRLKSPWQIIYIRTLMVTNTSIKAQSKWSPCLYDNKKG